ncbi:hypothetical protein ANCCAN_12533 [Ancylostoma caninum]|uniref:Uncharacterized protein n=1 Tax=Ancylostoma caninum TaxID=29170 RepID=A0A368GEP0_ANCCA|nr:hypothetical protein ANCCAN_12533 [Ancylostoma caninum]
MCLLACTSSFQEEIAVDVVDNSVDSCDVVMTELDGVRLADFNEISMLVDMFYLPFECGRRAMDLLEQFSWLYENALAMNATHISEQALATTQDEWRRRFSVLQNLIQTVNNLFKYIVDCPNKPLVSELIPYIWDAHGSCAVLLGIARWMNEGFVTIRPDEQPRSWTSDREDEPWMIGGGFLSECSKIIAPQGPIMNLFANRALLPLSIVNYLIRPYTSDDLSCEIDNWFPIVPEDILELYPAWLDARLLVDAYDAGPTKKLVQTAASTLYINGCSGIFVAIPVNCEDHVNFFTRIGFAELGKSIDERFLLLGHLLAVDEEFRE